MDTFLSKRQKQRLVKRKINEITNNLLDSSNSQNFRLKVPKSLAEVSENVLKDLFSESHVANDNFSFNNDITYSSYSHDNNYEETEDIAEDSIDTVLPLKNSLQHWISSNNLTKKAVNELLQILKPHFPSLPCDFRTIMKTPRKSSIIKLNNGEMHYFGLKQKLLSNIEQGGLTSTTRNILLQVNVDGLPLFKSSSVCFWPILVLSKDFVNESPFCVAIFCGTEKPDPIHAFLNDFIKEVKMLQTDGLLFQNEKYLIQIHFFITDAPARAYLRQTLGHTSKLGCEKCQIIGMYEDNRVIFDTNLNYAEKSDEDFFNLESHKYIKDKSPLLELSIGMVSQFPLDPMHLVFLGVVKRLFINYYLEGDKKIRLSQNQKKYIDELISSIRPYVSSDFTRKPRLLNEIKKWKATEFRLFLLYTGPIILYNSLDSPQYKHFLNLHAAIFILNDDTLIENYLDVAKDLLQNFVKESKMVLGKSFIVFNVHSLIHLIEDVKKYGNINNFSCFPFESYLYTIKRKIHCGSNPLQQIHRRIEEYDNLKISITLKNKSPEPKQIYKEMYDVNGCHIFFHCKKLTFNNIFISVDKPDNCILTQHNKVCIIECIRFINNEFILDVHCFMHNFDLYEIPINSSNLNIFYVTKSTKGMSLPLNHFKCKMLLLPHKTGFAAFPLNHTSNKEI